MPTPARKFEGVFAELQAEVKVPDPLVITPEITLYAPTKKQLRASRDAVDEDASEKALLGDQYEALHDLFNDQPGELWAEFNKRYIAHFLPQAGSPEEGNDS